MTALHRLTLATVALACGCVQDQDLSQPISLPPEASGDGGSSGDSGDSGDGNVSATSTTGGGAECLVPSGTRTSLELYAPEDQAPLTGMGDAEVAADGTVHVSFLQPTYLLAEITPAGDATFSADAGGLDMLAPIALAPDGSLLVGASGFTGDVPWLVRLDAAGDLQWSAAGFRPNGFYNRITNDVAIAGDGTSLAMVAWYDLPGGTSLVHLDDDGVVLTDTVVDDSGSGSLTVASNGDVWIASVVSPGTESKISRFTAGDLTTPVSAWVLDGRAAMLLRVDPSGRPHVLSVDGAEGPDGGVTPHVLVERLAADGSVEQAWDNVSTPDFKRPTSLAFGRCGELFIGGGLTEIAGNTWVAHVDDGGVVWSDTFVGDSTGRVFIDETGTLSVVGMAPLDTPDPKIGVYVARYEP